MYGYKETPYLERYKLVLSRRNNVYSGGVHVTFISEAAVDEGRPRREFFRLVLAELAHNNALTVVNRGASQGIT